MGSECRLIYYFKFAPLKKKLHHWCFHLKRKTSILLWRCASEFECGERYEDLLVRSSHERVNAHFGLAVNVDELRSSERAILRTVVAHKRLITS